MKTTSKYFEITLRVDQAAALLKMLDEEMLWVWCHERRVGTKQEVKILRGLRSQIDIELSRRRQDDVDAAQTMDSSSSGNEREQEHPTDAVDVDGEVQGKHWLGEESGRVPLI